MADRLPVPLVEIEPTPTRQAAQFEQVPVVAVYDSPLVPRGFPAQFRVRILDGSGEFTILAMTEDNTALASEDDYEPVSQEFTFTDDGIIEVETGGDVELGDEFFLKVFAVSPMLLVRDRATARIGTFDCVYDPGEVYEVGVYECT